MLLRVATVRFGRPLPGLHLSQKRGPLRKHIGREPARWGKVASILAAV